MRRNFSVGFLAGLLLATVTGCGSGNVVVTGKLSVDGRPFTSPDKEELLLALVDTDGEGTIQQKQYYAEINRDGNFKIIGRDGAGIPPGKYRVNASCAPLERIPGRSGDLFGNIYDGKNSPLVFDISSGNHDFEIALKKPGKS